MSTSTEKLSSPCHNQWFDTVSTNLGTSLGFDHNDEKNVRFLTLATFILWKIILLNIETTGVSVKRIPMFFNKELVSSFFLVNLSGGHFFVTADQR